MKNMFRRKFHWYLLTFVKVGENGSTWGIVTTYIGNEKQCISKTDINMGREFIDHEDELTLMSVSYMGRMTDKEFK